MLEKPYEQKKSKESLKPGKILLTRNIHFFKSVAQYQDLPSTPLPEFAFIGCSNVGKSSLINALTNRKKLAYTSNKPGSTRTLNYFSVGEKASMVDVPGYGYTRRCKVENNRCQNLIEQYLKYRSALIHVYLLIDSRHGVKNSDSYFMRLLAQVEKKYTLVRTKTDKKIARAKKITRTEDIPEYDSSLDLAIDTSAKKHIGVDKLRSHIYTTLTTYTGIDRRRGVHRANSI